MSNLIFFVVGSKVIINKETAPLFADTGNVARELYDKYLYTLDQSTKAIADYQQGLAMDAASLFYAFLTEITKDDYHIFPLDCDCPSKHSGILDHKHCLIGIQVGQVDIRNLHDGVLLNDLTKFPYDKAWNDLCIYYPCLMEETHQTYLIAPKGVPSQLFYYPL